MCPVAKKCSHLQNKVDIMLWKYELCSSLRSHESRHIHCQFSAIPPSTVWAPPLGGLRNGQDRTKRPNPTQSISSSYGPRSRSCHWAAPHYATARQTPPQSLLAEHSHFISRPGRLFLCKPTKRRRTNLELTKNYNFCGLLASLRQYKCCVLFKWYFPLTSSWPLFFFWKLIASLSWLG
jgi:hypothetical protein